MDASETNSSYSQLGADLYHTESHESNHINGDGRVPSRASRSIQFVDGSGESFVPRDTVYISEHAVRRRVRRKFCSARYRVQLSRSTQFVDGSGESFVRREFVPRARLRSSFYSYSVSVSIGISRLPVRYMYVLGSTWETYQSSPFPCIYRTGRFLENIVIPTTINPI